MKNRKIAAMCLVTVLLSTTGSFLAGCAGDRYSRSTGEYIDDKTLSMRVSSAIHDDKEYKLDGVSVTVYRGTAQLSGFVDTQDQKAKAGMIAKGVQGVQSVENNVSIKPGTGRNE